MAGRLSGARRTIARTIGAMLLIWVGVSGCSGGTGEKEGAGGGRTAGGTRVEITGTGATFPEPIYSKWFSGFHAANPQISVNYQGLGSGAGIQQLKNRTVDFGASDAPLSDDEQKEMPQPVIQIPTVAGAVAMTYNLPDTHTGLKLTPEVVAGIFLGTIQRWNDPQIAAANAGTPLPDRAILVVHRSDGSGTTHLFTHYLSAVSPEWKSRVGAGKSVRWPTGQGGKGNEGVTQVVRQTPGSIGYVELAFALQNEMPCAAVRNASGAFVAPNVASIAAAVTGSMAELKKDVRSSIVNSQGAGAYPISGLTYLLLYREQADAAKAQAMLRLLTWMFKSRSDAEALHYSPLPEELIGLNRKTMSVLDAGGASAGGGTPR